MDNRQPSYDRLAKYYDFLSRLVFFKSQVRAQTDQLVYIKNCKNLLIVGGGTGWILKDLNKIQHPISVTFVETSIKMIELAKNVHTHHQVRFVHQDIEQFEADIEFDSILTPFLFDNFDEAKAENVFDHLNQMLASKGIWIYTDFKLDGTWWKKVLLESMYLFFRLTNVVKVNSLPKMDFHFTRSSFQLMIDRNYFKRFIEAKVYRKE